MSGRGGAISIQSWRPHGRSSRARTSCLGRRRPCACRWRRARRRRRDRSAARAQSRGSRASSALPTHPRPGLAGSVGEIRRRRRRRAADAIQVGEPDQHPRARLRESWEKAIDQMNAGPILTCSSAAHLRAALRVVHSHLHVITGGSERPAVGREAHAPHRLGVRPLACSFSRWCRRDADVPLALLVRANRDERRVRGWCTERTMSLAHGKCDRYAPAFTWWRVAFLSKPPTTTMPPLEERATQRTRPSRGILHSVPPDTMSNTVTSWLPPTASFVSPRTRRPPAVRGSRGTAAAASDAILGGRGGGASVRRARLSSAAIAAS